MKFLSGFMLFFLLLAGSQTTGHAQNFDEAAFYKIMATGDISAVEKQIKIAEALPANVSKAYSGALLMKMAGMIKGPSKKLNTFKDGHRKLEEMIQKENTNAEWRFLRLIIQEKAPRILKYNQNIKDDATYIESHLSDLSVDVRAAVNDYRQHSNVL